MRRLMYGEDEDSGCVVSRLGSEYAWPVLDFEGIGQGGEGYEPGDFRGPMRYQLERISIFGVGSCRPTPLAPAKVPRELRNRHRTFWGLEAL